MLGMNITFVTRFFSILFAVLLMFNDFAFAKGNGRFSKNSIVKFERMKSGQYIIDVKVNALGPFKFMIDTAATRSSIFESTGKKLGLEIKNDNDVLISGMTVSSYRPTVNVETLQFSRFVFRDHKIVILKNWKDSETKIDGILGLDVLNDLILQFSHEPKQLRFHKKFNAKKSKYRRWDIIDLLANPYLGEDYGLLFVYTQIGDVRIPTMFDTGANFTTLNWESVKGTTIEKHKRRLLDEWVIQGAIGKFSPKSHIKLDGLIIAGRKYKNYSLVVMDFDDLPINNYGKYPLVITGVNLMSGQDFILDLKSRKLLIKPQFELFDPHNLVIRTRKL